jgi:hypothetical protein
MRELGFRMGGWWRRPDGRMDGHVNGWTDGRPRWTESGRTADTGNKSSRASKTDRGGRTGRGREDRSGLPEHERCPREAS